jgi:hypothetical protein
METVARVLCGSVLALSTSWTLPTLAAIPADYQGTPYGGSAQPIPGKIEFENVDLGGFGVAYDVDHHENMASGKDYRPAEDIPQICRTNTDEWVDVRPDQSVYPSAATPLSHYIGWAHAGDWVNLTVDVQQAGTYSVSSTFAAEPDEIGFTMAFNGVDQTGLVELAGSGDFHIWQEYPDFATVELEAGLQVLTFALEIEHLQYDFLQFELVGGSAGSGGTAGAGGSAGSSGSSNAGSSGSGGSESAGATSGGAGGSDSNLGGSATTTAGTSSSGAPSATPAADENAGCACRHAGGRRHGAYVLACVLFACAALARRRAVR